MSMFAIGTVTVASSVIAPRVAGAATSCGSSPAVASYTVVVTVAAKPTGSDEVSAVVISNLATGCDHKTATLKLKGNAAGNPAAPTTIFRTATSAKDPCTTATLTPPTKVQTGSITFKFCSKPNMTASYISVHDLTHVALTIAGTAVTVTPTTSASSNNGGPTTGSANSGTHNVPVSTAASSSGLAFTGADIAAMTGGGLLIILLGLFLLLISRRRRRSQVTGDAAP